MFRLFRIFRYNLMIFNYKVTGFCYCHNIFKAHAKKGVDYYNSITVE